MAMPWRELLNTSPLPPPAPPPASASTSSSSRSGCAAVTCVHSSTLAFGFGPREALCNVWTEAPHP